MNAFTQKGQNQLQIRQVTKYMWFHGKQHLQGDQSNEHKKRMNLIKTAKKQTKKKSTNQEQKNTPKN